MIVVELWVRHTRRHMPTRRVALGGLRLAAGDDDALPLLAAMAATFGPGLDDEQREGLGELLTEARLGLRVPRVALRYRLQTDTHGLDRSRHRLLLEHGRLVAELDGHGDPAPQVLAAVLAATRLAPDARASALRVIGEAVRTGRLPRRRRPLIRRLPHGPLGATPRFAATGRARPGGPDGNGAAGPGTGGTAGPGGNGRWDGVAAEHRWAMEVFGFGPGTRPEVAEVHRRFRRRVRDAHPDHGGDRHRAAERLAELAEARAVLLEMLAARDRA